MRKARLLPHFCTRVLKLNSFHVFGAFDFESIPPTTHHWIPDYSGMTKCIYIEDTFLYTICQFYMLYPIKSDKLVMAREVYYEEADQNNIRRDAGSGDDPAHEMPRAVRVLPHLLRHSPERHTGVAGCVACPAVRL